MKWIKDHRQFSAQEGGDEDAGVQVEGGVPPAVRKIQHLKRDKPQNHSLAVKGENNAYWNKVDVNFKSFVWWWNSDQSSEAGEKKSQMCTKDLKIFFKLKEFRQF